MFRRLEHSLPPDFIFPADLKSLGYFLNDNDQIRMIDDPEEPFNYFASKNERFLEMQREAMLECEREIINERLRNLNVGRVPLPYTRNLEEPHVPIMTSKNLDKASRIIVYIGENTHDIEHLAGRIVSKESINRGSVVNFAHDVLSDPSTEYAQIPEVKRGLNKLDLSDMSKTGLVIANPGQLIWWRRGKKAMGYESWGAIPRKYGCGDGPLLTAKNRITRNHDSVQHVQCLFDDCLYPLMKTGLKIDIIAVGDAMDSVVQTLDRDWSKWSEAVQAIVLCANGIYDPEIENEEFAKFWGKRARAYVVDGSPLGTPMTGRHILGCNVYSSGVNDFVECIMPRSYKEFLDYFKLVKANPNYEATPQNSEAPEQEQEIQWGVQTAGDVDIDVHLDSDGELENVEVGGAEHGKIAESA